MKLQFKKQPFQLDAVSAIADIFQGQGKQSGIRYMADPGRQKSDEVDLVLDAYRNAPILVLVYDLLTVCRSIWLQVVQLTIFL